MLHLLIVGSIRLRGPRVIARRCTDLLLPRLGQTDGRTDRRTRHRFNTLTAYAVGVINMVYYGIIPCVRFRAR